MVTEEKRDFLQVGKYHRGNKIKVIVLDNDGIIIKNFHDKS